MVTASEVLSAIKSAFPGSVKEERVESDRRLWITVDPGKLLDMTKFLRDKHGFDHYSGAAGVDRIADNLFEVVEILTSHGAHQVVVLMKVKTPRDAPSVNSLTGLYWNANWYEREIWEMYGINFPGHPELYPLLLPDELVGAFPWRKDFKGYPDTSTGRRAVESVTSDGHTEFTIMPTDKEMEGGVFQRIKVPNFREREEMELGSDAEMIMHMGPQHAVVPGPFLLDLLLDGERVKRAFLDVGYIHKGIEKIMENRNWLQALVYTDRMCYMASISNNEAYCGAVEKLLGIVPTERAQYIRVILAELSRIQSHLLGTAEFLTLIASAIYSPFMYMIIDREDVVSLIESVTGARITHTFVRFGGVRNDLPPDFKEKTLPVLKMVKEKTLQYKDLLASDSIYKKRMVGVGVLTAEKAKNLGVSGPALRATNVAYDMRREDPHLVYPDLDFDVITRTAGDSAARVEVRLDEILESVKIIEQCLDRIPEGPIQEKLPKKIKPEPGEAYYRVEDPRGEMGFYVVSDGSDKPYRVKVRGPVYAYFQALPPLLEGAYIADVVAIAGSMDACTSEVDR
ncbi:MAG: F(420)H(2) dehydrogenase subunit D [Methanosaeta sp. PtaB.Bin039]|nr:MAG: F(420)H(2) dehydrogenase subunit D [Methanosaeta sp. PtaB.Bin039]HQF16617.1 F420H2 dehydrogenase subunit FpoD [Methanotrichaceae archaeon]HQI91249.1 F420H2 dehydrogenase subunit FpoD [Methanotrichaceae archaeon]HQJ61703.1 F420H2 dehydrogenase subunit FpoD [Methanothrix soehngenii]